MMGDKTPQLDKFKDAVSQLECSEDDTPWDERLKELAKAKPTPG